MSYAHSSALCIRNTDLLLVLMLQRGQIYWVEQHTSWIIHWFQALLDQLRMSLVRRTQRRSVRRRFTGYWCRLERRRTFLNKDDFDEDMIKCNSLLVLINNWLQKSVESASWELAELLGSYSILSLCMCSERYPTGRELYRPGWFTIQIFDHTGEGAVHPTCTYSSMSPCRCNTNSFNYWEGSVILNICCDRDAFFHALYSFRRCTYSSCVTYIHILYSFIRCTCSRVTSIHALHFASLFIYQPCSLDHPWPVLLLDMYQVLDLARLPRYEHIVSLSGETSIWVSDSPLTHTVALQFSSY